jgi:hypothetical protein
MNSLNYLCNLRHKVCAEVIIAGALCEVGEQLIHYELHVHSIRHTE